MYTYIRNMLTIPTLSIDLCHTYALIVTMFSHTQYTHICAHMHLCTPIYPDIMHRYTVCSYTYAHVLTYIHIYSIYTYTSMFTYSLTFMHTHTHI